MKVKVGVSNRHVHLSFSDYKLLFGDKVLEKRNDLSQSGEFASICTVSLKGAKGIIEKVRVMGPCRDYTQVEVSKTDCFVLGINPPVRDSGDLNGASEITIINGDKQITRNSAIIAARHIHITKDLASKYNIGSVVSVKVLGEKPAILSNVHVKVKDSYSFELHLDTDDANANLISSSDEVEIID